MADTIETAVFGGGCFWCVEAVFAMLDGVISVTPGYTGGTTPHPSYETVSTGKTGHAEAVKITYDPSRVTFNDLLTVFFATHDPTTPNRQGADIGPQYRSIIFYTTNAQKKAAEQFIQQLNSQQSQDTPIITEAAPFKQFWEAEDYHRDYYAKNTRQPYCQLVINPKLEKVKKQFTKLLKDAQWKKILTPSQYHIMREGGTEPAGSGTILHEKRKGQYHCGACGSFLFSSDAKFDSGTGWPSFTKPVDANNISLEKHSRYGMDIQEVLCKKCGGHLGDVFDDGPKEQGGKRYCINSASLEFRKQ